MTSSVRYRFRAELRTRRRAWLGLGRLVGLAAGAVLPRPQVLPVTMVAIVAAAVLANLIAFLPGQLAARTPLAAILRSE